MKKNRQKRKRRSAPAAAGLQPPLSKVMTSDRGLLINVHNLDGEAILDVAAMFPIWMRTRDGETLMIGTGFFVSRFGHFLTAKHVLMEVHDARAQAFMLYPVEGNGVIVRDVLCFSHSATADVALGTLNHPPGYVFNMIPTLTTDCPALGEGIVTLGYDASTKYEPGQFTLAPRYLSGTLEEVHLDGRDRIVLPFPCYRSSLTLPGGASGGPVFDARGRVFGINCTGFDGTDIAYLTRIADATDLVAAGMKLTRESEPQDFSLYELGVKEYVPFDPPLPPLAQVGLQPLILSS